MKHVIQSFTVECSYLTPCPYRTVFHLSEQIFLEKVNVTVPFSDFTVKSVKFTEPESLAGKVLKNHEPHEKSQIIYSFSVVQELKLKELVWRSLYGRLFNSYILILLVWRGSRFLKKTGMVHFVKGSFRGKI